MYMGCNETYRGRHISENEHVTALNLHLMPVCEYASSYYCRLSTFLRERTNEKAEKGKQQLATILFSLLR